MFQQNGDEAVLAVPVNKQDHFLGNPDAPIQLVEYGDYECPFCADAFYRLSEFFASVDLNQILYVFRNFPLTQIHPHAEESAEAAEISADFDKFWEMHSTLFQNQRQLDEEDLLVYAGELDIPPEKFARELYSHAKAKLIREQLLSGARSGVNGTPSFFVNEERFPGDVRGLISILSTEMGRGH